MLLPKKAPNLGSEKKGADVAQVMQAQMTYFFPIFTIIILISLPSALGLYWTISGIFSIIQQYIILKDNKKTELTKA